MYMSDIFIPYETEQTTRNSMNRFKIPMRKTNMGQNCLSYLGPWNWNSLPCETFKKNRNIFEHKLKSNIIKGL